LPKTKPEGKTDWQRLARQSDEETAQQAAADPDTAPLLTKEWLERAKVVNRNKTSISIRLDPEVLEFFKSEGKNYQTRINNVLRAYYDLHRKSA
jgi:uncharacterized protein (DUF4415 family)